MRYECDECGEVVDEGDIDHNDSGHEVCPECGNEFLTMLDDSEYGN